jgi:hypothetical protein
MSRPSQTFPGPALLAGLILLAGCSPSRPPAGAENLALPPAGGVASSGGRVVQSPPASTAPAAPVGRPIGETPLPIQGRPNDPAAVAAACRTWADQVIVQRDRSQLMREDERDSRLGIFNDSPFQLTTPTDRMGRQFERDRIARDCVQQHSQGTPDR